ncbi:MAG: S41 family peptidase [Bacteroidales bacterium]|jgi:carboxyl-terminal processing protease|nr:S41 family peptidase [Bacteroidales bacterium]
MEIKNRKIDALLPLIIALVLVIGILAGIHFGRSRPQTGSISNRGLLFYRPDNKVTQALDLITSSYVDSVSSNQLEEDAITGMLKTLDPHSQYIPAAKLAAVNEPIEGNFSGIGVQFNMLNDTIIVVNTTPKGPSEKVGVMAGDRIVEVDGTTVAGIKMSSNDIVKMLKGKTGTKVKVGIFRRGEKDLLYFDIVRDKIPLFSVDVAYMLTPEIGYVKVNTFSRTTIKDFTDALIRLKSEGLEKLIIDLRNNSGGIIDGAIGMSELFLPEGSLIVYTEGNERPRYDYFSKAKNSSFADTELIILINEITASASEIVSGAIQDNDRGTIIGRRSFGKGLVQEQHKLNDGSAIRITVSRYYTPTGRSIQKPYDGGLEKYYNELRERRLHGEMNEADSIHFNDSLRYITPKGKVVYGGGGIMPDIFVPVDTSYYSVYFEQIIQRGLIYRFALNYSDVHRKELSNVPDYQTLEKNLRKGGIMEQFIKYTSEQGIKRNNKDLKISGNAIENMVIAYIVRNIFDDNGFYPVFNQDDPMILKAIEVFTSDK